MIEETIQKLQNELGLNGVQLAKALEISQAMLSRLKSGERRPSLVLFGRLLRLASTELQAALLQAYFPGINFEVAVGEAAGDCQRRPAREYGKQEVIKCVRLNYGYQV